jgi:hypothetical protein
VQGITVEATSNIFSIAIEFIPYIGMVISMFELIPVIGSSIPWILSYSTGYLVMNMVNANDSNSYCLTNKYKLFMSIISIIIITGFKTLNYYL